MDILERLSPSQLTALVATVVGSVVLIVFIAAVWHYQSRALADETALKRERQQAEFALRQEVLKRNLPPAELRTALDTLGLEGAGGDLDADDRAALIKNLVYCAEGAPPTAIEETVALVAAADPVTRRGVFLALTDLVEDESQGEHVLATIRALCRGHAAGTHAVGTDTIGS